MTLTWLPVCSAHAVAPCWHSSSSSPTAPQEIEIVAACAPNAPLTTVAATAILLSKDRITRLPLFFPAPACGRHP